MPLAFAAYYVSNDHAKIGFGLLAVVCFLAGAYRLWAAERKVAVRLQQKLEIIENARPVLELIFDENDPRCVRDEHYPFEGKPLKFRRWLIGVRNASWSKSADDVTLRAHESWFVENTFVIAHEDPRSTRSARSPIIFKAQTLEPLALEFVELFGLSTNLAQSPGDVFRQSHEFVIEGRARDAATIVLTLKYEPTEPPAIIKV